MWLLGATLLPFIAGAAIAYLLDPLADRLERLGLSRTLATAIDHAGVILVFVALVLLAVPALIGQAQALVAAVPGYIDGDAGIPDAPLSATCATRIRTSAARSPASSSR